MITIRPNRYATAVISIVALLPKYLTLLKRSLFGGKKHILIIKYDRVGDLVLWIPYASVLRNFFSKSEYDITMEIRKENIDFVRILNITDHIIVHSDYRNRWQYLFQRIFFWGCHYYDIIITPLHANDLVIPYRPKQSIAFRNRFSKEFITKSGTRYDLLISDKLNVTDSYQAVLDYFHIVKSLPSYRDFYSLWNTKISIPKQSYIAVCTGASDPKRCWEKEKFLSLIGKLRSLYHKDVLLLGSANEYAVNEWIRDHLADSEHIWNLCGKTSIQECFVLMHNACFLVSNETGTAHIGVASDTMTFIICGGGDYGHFVPYPENMEGKRVFSIFTENHDCFRCGWSNPDCAKEETYPCIKAITINRVLNTIMDIIKTNI